MGKVSSNIKNHRFVFLSILVSLSLLFGTVGCAKTNDSGSSKNADATAIQSTDAATKTAASAETTAADTKATAVSENTTGTSATVTETTAAPTLTVPAETTHAPVVNKAAMYSSYALLSSFDPATGLAEFDYFDMLTGQDAIDWLVSHEGYTQAEAEDTVNNFADGEFDMKNVNPQLRTVDLSVTPLKAIYYADGSQTATWPESEPISFADFVALYDVEKAGSDGITYVTGNMFYYITVVNNQVTEVKQVFWV
jgi:hypothetical protein